MKMKEGEAQRDRTLDVLVYEFGEAIQQPLNLRKRDIGIWDFALDMSVQYKELLHT